MTQDEIIRMAREAGIGEVGQNHPKLHAFAALVAAHTKEEIKRTSITMLQDGEAAVLAEREACAKVCDDIAKCCFVENPARKVVESTAAAIRARGD